MRKPTAKNKLNPPIENRQAHDESTVPDTSNDATSLRKYKKKEAQSTDIEELTESTPNWEPEQDALFENSPDADMGTLEPSDDSSDGYADQTDATVGQAAPSFDLNHFILSGAYEYAALEAASSSTLLTAGAGLIGAAALGGGSSATKTNLNHAPTIVDQAIYLPQISSGASAPIGQVGALVSTLTTGIRDANEGDRKGIAITEIDDKLGLLFYSLNNGVTWTLAEGVSPSNALLLADDANTRIYIRPASNHQGLVSDVAQFRGWDQTTGTHGSRSDVRQFGGNSAFSGEVESIGLNMVTSLIGDYSENGAPIAAHPNLELPTPMNGKFSAASVEIMGGFSQGDVLSVTNEGPFTAVYHSEAGRLEINGIASLTEYQTFLRKVTFRSNVDDPLKFGAIRSLVWQISDEAGNLYENQFNQLRIIAENDAPILIPEAIKLSDAAFGSGLPVASSGDLVSRFVSTVMDPDGIHAKSGLAIIQIAPHVILYFSTDGGLNWHSATDLSPTNALHLMKDSDNKIYLQTLPGFSGNIHESFSFRAWDQTSGIDGLMSAALPVGGTSAYSLEIGGGLTPWTTVFNLTSSSPADNGYMVNVTDNLTLTFNRPTAMGTGSIQLYTAAGTLVETIHVTSSLVTGWGGHTLTVNPNTTLTAGAAYYLRISPAAIRDTVGHTYAGINDSTTLNFGVLASDGSVEANMNTDPTRSAVGYSVSGAGDVNGDGYADYLVGGSNTDNSVFVVYGDASGLGTNFTGGTIESSKGFRFYSVGNQVGIFLSGVGDVNGDGFDDVMLASTATSGLTYVVYGGVSNAGITTDANGNIPTSAGFKITGNANSHLGYSVSGAGDVNGDGIADLIFGAMGTGSAYVMFGQAANRANFNLSGRTISSTDGFEIKGLGGSGLGRAVSSAGDVNGDGLADLVVSNGQDRVTYVVYGKTNGLTLNLSSFAPKDGFRITSLENTSRFGWSVDSAGDVNGDGLADVLLTSELTNSVYVVFGNASGTSVAIDSSGNIADGLGFKIKSNMANSLGYSASSAGDVNGDGLSDIIIGTHLETSAGAFVVFGKSSNATVSISNGKILSNDGFKITGATNGAFGFSVSGAGDINGDGLADVLVGSKSKGYALVLGGTQWTAAAVPGSGAVTGTSAAEAIIGSAGADTLTGGGGVDRFFAGMGNDTIVLTSSDITNLANTTAGAPKASVHGGGGFDTLRLSGGANLNLLTITNVGAMGHEEDSRIESIERIDLATDTAANALTLSSLDIKDMADLNVIRNGGGSTWVSGTYALGSSVAFHQMVVEGSANDALTLTTDRGTWVNMGTVSNGGTTYNVYQNTAMNTQLFSASAITNVAFDLPPVLVSSNPSDNGYLMAVGNNITLNFNEAVSQGTGTIAIYRSSNNALLESFNVASSSLVTGWNSNTVTINPTSDLLASTGYHIQIGSTAVKDAIGNHYSGISDTTTLNFTTAASDGSIAPTVYIGPASTNLGYSVSGAGDVNGDGFGDYILGTNAATGGAYVVYGDASGLGINLPNGTIASSRGFKISGGNSLGFSVSGIGDVNGDGLDDVIVGSSSSAGAAYVVYGNTSGTGLTLDGSNNITNSSSGFRITGRAGSNLGSFVSGAGDVNGDGLADFIVGAPNQSGAGNAYVVYGKFGTGNTGLSLVNGTIAAADGFQIKGNATSGLGRSVSAAGDVNGDGLSDLIVTGADKTVYVVYGNSTGTTVDLSLGTIADRGFKITSDKGTTFFGNRASSAGDVNGDGLADVIVGSEYDNSAYVIYGNASGTDVAINSTAGIASSSGFRIVSAKLVNFGLWVSGAGDVNGDGLGDFIIGNDNNYVGAYVVYGNASGTTVNIDTNGSIAAASGFRISGPTSGLYSFRVSGAGDINGDGMADLLVGSNAAGYSLVMGGTQWLTAAVSGSGTVTGTASAEAVVGSAAADTLTGGGGVDRFYAGMGNDTVVLTASDVTNLANNTAGGPKALVNGGGGFDTIRMSGGAALDLTTISNAGAMGQEENSRIESIERIDLATDTAANTLTLAARDVKDMASFNLIRTGSVSADGNTWTNVTGSTRASGVLNFETAPAGISRVWFGSSSDWALANGSFSGDADLEDVLYSAANSGRYRNLDYTAIAAGNAVTTINAGFNFAMSRVNSQSGDGLNFSFGDKSSLGNFELGYSRGLSIKYGGLNVFAPDQKVRIYWNGTQIGVSTADITLDAKHTTNVSVSDAGVVTVLLNGNAFATGTISGWQTVDKSGWMFGYGGRTGTATGSAWVDDFTATANTQALGSTTNAHQLVVDGSSNDTVVLSPDLGGWTNVGTVSNGISNYTVFAQSLGSNSQVLVRSGVVVNNNDLVAPLVLDLNRDGVLCYGQVTMDVNGDGHLDTTAWAAAQDGVLVWDKYSDSLVHDNSQYAFAQYAPTYDHGLDAQGKAPTDLSGLAAGFDTNLDGLLNDQDALFAEFMVWQDANQNGVSDAGEVRSLADWGITEIHLVSDGVQRTPAPGVVEAGRTTATLTDGTHLLVSDAAFEYTTINQQALYML